MPAQRWYQPKSVPDPNVTQGFRRVHRFQCSACPVVHDIPIKFGASGGLGAEILERQMKRAGWELGARPTKDLCQACAQAKRKKKIEKKGDVIHMAKYGAAGISVVTENQPREMSRDDRRIIFAKLNDVYIDETTGYGNGWSDKKVAEDLSVPRAWVEEIREENFGPIQISEEAKEQIAELQKLERDANSLLTQMKAEATKHKAVFDSWHKSLLEATAKLEAEMSSLSRRIRQAELILKAHE